MLHINLILFSIGNIQNGIEHVLNEICRKLSISTDLNYIFYIDQAIKKWLIEEGKKKLFSIWCRKNRF